MNTGQQMQALYSRFGDIDEVTIELHKELLAINIHNRTAEATIFLQGAQLSQYQPHKEQGVIWLSPECDYKAGSPLRGGIPICWPWFGALDKNPEAIQQQVCSSVEQAHGFVRTLEWDVDFIQAISLDETELQMSLTLDANNRWPFACKLVLKFTIGARLTLCFEVQNNDSKSFVFTSALHSYFAIGDIRQAKISGLDNKPFIDALNDRQVFTQRGDITIDREIDRIYETNGENVQIVDNQWQRQISIVSKSSANAVVWNPWVEKSKRLSQFSDSNFEKMLCVESANIGSAGETLQPGERHIQLLEVMSQALSLESTGP
jgi:glucose-6-phosphate 1-epimerase